MLLIEETYFNDNEPGRYSIDYFAPSSAMGYILTNLDKSCYRLFYVKNGRLNRSLYLDSIYTVDSSIPESIFNKTLLSTIVMILNNEFLRAMEDRNMNRFINIFGKDITQISTSALVDMIVKFIKRTSEYTSETGEGNEQS